ncbi:Ger(x)C family spore germination protein [Cytobacillus massiliigabonensis]|uniref:Ger(x)C family spore germination protein n=1 Tax=Cytobacillus massiliigabonensis TaxID=1871011 RepID=UPI000C84EB06|nr:Ger(x)C family spore germination protein [Cytobacillus massiliigabonensis]
MKKTTIAVLIIVHLFLLTACVQERYLEKQGLITAVGYDLLEDNKLFGSIVVLLFNPTAPNFSIVLKEETNTSKGIRGKLTLDTSHNLVSGQLRTAIFGRELAEKGISSMVDSLNRDATIGNMVYMMISETTAEDVIEFNEIIKKNNDVGTYLYNLIKHNIDTEEITSNTLHEFMHDFQDIGNDPILPIIQMKNNRVGISGIALFHDDRLVDTMPISRKFYLKLLVNRYREGGLEIKLSKNGFQKITGDKLLGQLNNDHFFLVLDSIESNKKISLKGGENLKFKVDIDITFRLLEVSEKLDLGDPNVIKQLEKAINNEIKHNIEQTLNQLQEVQSDPVNFAGVYQEHSRQKLTQEKWDDLYNKATFSIHIHSKLKSTGVTN